MPKNILIVQGHPDPAGGHFCNALESAYANGARHAGHDVSIIHASTSDFSILRTQEEFDTGKLTADIKTAQDSIQWADHLVIIYPLWLGTMPALLKGFFEQVLRPNFGFLIKEDGRWEKRLKGRTARVVITMGMPAFVYRWYFGAHSLRSLERNILGFCGIAPIRTSLIGIVDAPAPKGRLRWLARMEKFGSRGD